MKKTIFLIALLVFIGCSKDFQDYCDCIEDGDYVRSEKFIESKIYIDGIFNLEDWLISQPCVFESYLIDKTDYSITHYIHFKLGYGDVKKVLHINAEGKLIINYIAYKE